VLLRFTNTGELLGSRGFVTSELKDTHPRLRITEVPPGFTLSMNYQAYFIPENVGLNCYSNKATTTVVTTVSDGHWDFARVLLRFTNTGELLGSRGFVTSELRDTHPRLRITEVPPGFTLYKLTLFNLGWPGPYPSP